MGQNIVTLLYELIAQSVSNANELQSFKLTRTQLSKVFAHLDYRRRGFIDLYDFSFNFPELNEQQLFYVFKFLDVRRKGVFTLDDFQLVLASTNNHLVHENQIKAFENLIKFLKTKFNKFQQHRKSYISTLNLQGVFRLITLQKKQKVDITDLIILFKQNKLQVNQKIISFLKTVVFVQPCLSLNQFVQTFSSFTCHSIGSLTDPKTKLKNQSNQLAHHRESQISKIDQVLNKYRSYNPQQKRNFQQRAPQATVPNNSYTQHRRQPKILHQQRNINLQTNKIDQLLMSKQPTIYHKQINQRRQQLRRGSIERQRIINDVINRKKVQMNSKPSSFFESQKQKYEPIMENNYFNSSNKYFNKTSASNSRLVIEQNRSKFENVYPRSPIQRQSAQGQVMRPSSACKTENNFFQRPSYQKLSNFYSSKPDLNHFYKKNSEKLLNLNNDKQNILRKAEEEATRKIQEIQRRARLKVMQKRSVAGVYNKWLK